MDLTSRLRAIVRNGPAKAVRELTYEPEVGRYEAGVHPDRLAQVLTGKTVATSFGSCLVIDRRYERDRRHGTTSLGECQVEDAASLLVLDPALTDRPISTAGKGTLFIDLETTGLSGGAGTVAFLVGCGYFDLGAFQVRQFLLTSYAAERALLAAVGDFLDGVDLIVSYNGKTFDLPVMETRWIFHRMEMPLEGVPHFDMLHAARRLWRSRIPQSVPGDQGGCRLSTLERALFGVKRAGDVQGFEIPSRFFRFLRSGDPRPLEAVLEHNRLDLVSLAVVTAHAAKLAHAGVEACRDDGEALALGRVYERANTWERAERCYRRAASSTGIETRAEALYRLGLRYRRTKRFLDAALCWQQLLSLTAPLAVRRQRGMADLRQFATEAMAIHHEHRVRDLPRAREVALFALEETDEDRQAHALRHRLARLDRKLARDRGFALIDADCAD